MCGRFTQKMSWREVHTLYRMPAQATPLNLQPRYNGCPTQDFTSVRLDGSERTAMKLRWGLVPSWAPDPGIGSRLINARAETVHERRAFRAAFKRRRCLIPADGWFEWRTEAGGTQPWFITASDRAPVSFAGLWERWEGHDEPIETFTIVTTAAAPGLVDIHHRQPSIIEADDFEEWLDPGTGTERLLVLARRAYDGSFDHWRVAQRVNSPRNEGADLVRPLDG